MSSESPVTTTPLLIPSPTSPLFEPSFYTYVQSLLDLAALSKADMNAPCLVVAATKRYKYVPKEEHASLDFEDGHLGSYKLVTKASQLDEAVKSMNHTFGLPKNVMVLYLHFTPRNQMEALMTMHYEMQRAYIQNTKEQDTLKVDFQKSYCGAVMASAPLFKVYMLDVDTEDVMKIQAFYQHCPEMVERVDWILKTQGGFHLIYKPGTNVQHMYRVAKEHAKFYEKREVPVDEKEGLLETDPKAKKVKAKVKYFFEVLSNAASPLPGSLQNGIVVKTMSLEEFEKKVFLV